MSTRELYKWQWCCVCVLYYRPRTYVRREVMFSQVCVCSGGGSQIFRGGLRFSGGGCLRFSGGGGGVPGLSKGKNFWHQIWLDTCSDWGKKFLPRDPPSPPLRNSKKLLWPRGGRYASCVHAGGLSCVNGALIFLYQVVWTSETRWGERNRKESQGTTSTGNKKIHTGS